MFPEIISPNVTYICGLALALKEGTAVRDVRIHKRGVIEIDTEFNPIEGVRRSFADYEEAGHLYPVNVTGFKPSEDFKRPITEILKGPEPDRIGSHRFCAWDGAFAKDLTEMLRLAEVPELYEGKDGLWEFQQVSKYFRFMRYDEGGEHFPHYDSDFYVYHNKGSLGQKPRYATKYSLVMYFNDCDSGEIAFIDHDGEKDGYDDWSRQAEDHEIYLKIKPKAGKIVLFPHNVCHTVLPFTDKDSQRFIVRGDLIFTRAD